jgi:hypothetical protein
MTRVYVLLVQKGRNPLQRQVSASFDDPDVQVAVMAATADMSGFVQSESNSINSQAHPIATMPHTA